nr:uncharacterized protein LOC109192291 [Ipomoea batatas]
MAYQRRCSSSDWKIHGENDIDSESESEGSEFNDHCGDDENIQNRDDIEFDEHINYGVEDSGLMNSLENEQVIKSVQRDLFDPNLSGDGSTVESDSHGEMSGELWSNFRPSTDMNDPQFTLQMTFASKKEFRDVVQNYAIKNGKDFKFVKNDKDITKGCRGTSRRLIYKDRVVFVENGI